MSSLFSGVILTVVVGFFVLWSHYDRLRREYDELRREHDGLRRELDKAKQRVSKLRQDARMTLLQEWLADWEDFLAQSSYYKEREVEIRVIYPLLKGLGYSDPDIRRQQPVKIQMGREKGTKLADFVVYKEGAPFLVIEAKNPTVRLSEEVRAQARSYCFGLHAPMYMVTNGQKVEIYRLNAIRDEKMFAGTLTEMAQRLEEIANLIGAEEASISAVSTEPPSEKSHVNPVSQKSPLLVIDTPDGITFRVLRVEVLGDLIPVRYGEAVVVILGEIVNQRREFVRLSSNCWRLVNKEGRHLHYTVDSKAMRQAKKKYGIDCPDPVVGIWVKPEDTREILLAFILPPDQTYKLQFGKEVPMEKDLGRPVDLGVGAT